MFSKIDLCHRRERKEKIMPEKMSGRRENADEVNEEIEEGIVEHQDNAEEIARREQLEKTLVSRVQFVEQDGKETGQKWMEGDQVMVTAYFEPTDVGKQIEELLKKYGSQYGTNNAWACIRSRAVMNAHDLAEKHGQLPKDKRVSRHFASDVYELGVDLHIDGGTTDDEKYGEEQANEEEAAVADMKKLAEEIKALGVDCKYQ